MISLCSSTVLQHRRTRLSCLMPLGRLPSTGLSFGQPLIDILQEEVGNVPYYHIRVFKKPISKNTPLDKRWDYSQPRHSFPFHPFRLAAEHAVLECNALIAKVDVRWRRQYFLHAPSSYYEVREVNTRDPQGKWRYPDFFTSRFITPEEADQLIDDHRDEDLPKNKMLLVVEITDTYPSLDE